MNIEDRKELEERAIIIRDSLLNWLKSPEFQSMPDEERELVVRFLIPAYCGFSAGMLLMSSVLEQNRKNEQIRLLDSIWRRRAVNEK